MTIEEDILGQTIAEVDTLSGWTAHYGGIRVTAVTDDGHTALVADGWGHPHRTLLAALNRHARQHMGGCGLDGHWPGQASSIRRVPLAVPFEDHSSTPFVRFRAEKISRLPSAAWGSWSSA